MDVRIGIVQTMKEIDVELPVDSDPAAIRASVEEALKVKEAGKAEEVFFVPPEVKLDSVLKKVFLLGNFPDTVSYSTAENAPITVISGLADVPEAARRKAADAASQGGTLVLGALTEEDARQWNALKTGVEPASFRSTGSPAGNFHYLKSSPAFKDLPAPGLLDQIFAEVQPLWSLDHMPAGTEVHAGSLNFLTAPGAKSKIRHGADLAVVPFGKGKQVF